MEFFEVHWEIKQTNKYCERNKVKTVCKFQIYVYAFL